MRWGPSAQTNRDWDIIIEEDTSPLEVMIAPDDPQANDGYPGKKTVHGAFVSAAQTSTTDLSYGLRGISGDIAITQTDWSLGMTFGLQDRTGKGGYSFGLGLDARSPRGVVPGGKVEIIDLPASGWTHAPIRGFAEFGSHVYIATGQTSITAPTATSAILRMVNGGSTVVVSGKYPSDSSPYFTGRSILQYGGYLYVGGYNGLMRRRMTTLGDPDAGPFDDTVPGDDSCWAGYNFQRVFLAKQHWNVAGIMSYYITASDTDHSWVYTAADPTISGNWSSPTGVYQDDPTVISAIGDPNLFSINSVAFSNRKIYWGKTNGIFDSDSTGYTPNLTPFVEDDLDDDNCIATYYYDSWVWFNAADGLHRLQTDQRVREDVDQYVHPGFGRPSEGPFFGNVTAITSDNGWLVIATYNGQDSFVLYGKDPQYLGLQVSVPMIWHGALAYFPGQKITAFGKSSVSGWPLLYIGLWDGNLASVATMYRLKTPTGYQAWKEHTDYRFQTNFQMYLTAEDLGYPNTQKTMLRGDISSENLAADRTLEAYTSIDSVTYADVSSAGDPLYVFSPPLSGTFTVSVFGYGTSAPIAADATTATMQTTIEEIDAGLVGNVSVSQYGTNTIKIVLANLPTNAVLAVSAGSIAFHLQGTARTSSRQAFIPASSTPNGYLLQTRIDGSGTETQPPVLRGLQQRLSVIEDQLEEKTMNIRFGAGVLNRQRVADSYDPLAKLALFTALMRRGTLKLTDEFGRLMTVKVNQGISYVQTEDEGGYAFTVTFKYKVQKQPFYWNAGGIWSDRFTWS